MSSFHTFFFYKQFYLFIYEIEEKRRSFSGVNLFVVDEKEKQKEREKCLNRMYPGRNHKSKRKMSTSFPFAY